jgi:NitT/TauT family transport system permease protein
MAAATRPDYRMEAGDASFIGARARALWHDSAPILAVLAVVVVVWYGGALLLNAHQVTELDFRGRTDWTWPEFVRRALTMARPVLPAPHQVAVEFFDSVFLRPPTSPRSLVYHAMVTSAATVLGFALGAVLGVVLAVLIVHSRTLDRGMLPWIIASQTVPVLAIAPIVIVLLGNLGITGLIPKAVISMYLCFFPVTLAMVQGLRSPGTFERELLHTYAASQGQTFWKLRLPAALPMLLPSLRVAIAAGLVGTIVAELPTGAQAGLGARLLNGSYYGNVAQIWAALLMAALLGLLLTGIVASIEWFALRRWHGSG